MKEMILKIWKRWFGKKTEQVKEHEDRKKVSTPKPTHLSNQLETYLTAHYDFRYNVLTEQAEVRRKELVSGAFRAATQRVVNTLCLEAQEQGIACWDKDVTRLLHSERTTDFHPFLDYMANLPKWDGIDRVTPLARRVSETEVWVKGFHKWLLGMAGQWSGRVGRCANTVAPLLVSTRQGMGKSTFCRLLMPESLADYYTDSFDLNSPTGCEQKLSVFGLVNLDEYDKLSPRKLPLLKNLMQMTTLHYRKAHRSNYTHLPRIASFIGTSNRKDLLTDPTGSRRYLCIELTEKIDCTPLEHKQLFAQLKAELDAGEHDWFTTAEEQELMEHNRPFYAYPPEQDVFFRHYRLPATGEPYELLPSSELYARLSKDFPHEMRGMNLNRFGRLLTSIGAERVHTVKGNLYKVVMVA